MVQLLRNPKTNQKPRDMLPFWEALKWLLPLAEAGDALACLLLGYISHYGLCRGLAGWSICVEGMSWSYGTVGEGQSRVIMILFRPLAS